MQERLSGLPVAFEHNGGQADRTVDFIARASGYQAYLGARSAIFQLGDGRTLTMRFDGARDVKPEPQQPLGFNTNYFHGSEAAQQFTNLANYSRVRYPSA